MKKNILSEKRKAQQDGYTNEFIFRGGRLCNLHCPEQTYAICQVVVGINYCPVDKCNVYRIETPEGRKGIATRTAKENNK